jgi:hypothetical protein
VFLRNGIRGGMNGFLALETYGNKRDVDRGGDANTRTYLDSALNTRLGDVSEKRFTLNTQYTICTKRCGKILPVSQIFQDSR